ncbi:MAG: NUDIX domain-containing protein [bacterium]
MERSTFYVGVGALVIRNNKILLGKRKGVLRDGYWCLPGGHLEFSESMGKAVARELLEETGMTADSFTFSNICNNPSKDRHSVQIAFFANNPKGEPEIKEPDRFYGWDWFSLDDLPKEIIGANLPLIKAYLEKRNFTDSK